MTQIENNEIGSSVRAKLNTALDKLDSVTIEVGGNSWNITLSDTGLVFSHAGTDLMKLDTSGNLTVIGDITAYGNIQ